MAPLYTSNGRQHLTLRTNYRVIRNDFLENTKDFPVLMAFLLTKGILMGESVRLRRPWAGGEATRLRNYFFRVRRWDGECDVVSLSQTTWFRHSSAIYPL